MQISFRVVVIQGTFMLFSNESLCMGLMSGDFELPTENIGISFRTQGFLSLARSPTISTCRPFSLPNAHLTAVCGGVIHCHATNNIDMGQGQTQP